MSPLTKLALALFLAQGSSPLAAELNDAEAVPHLDGRGRDGYRHFLATLPPRAFAIAPGGAWGYSTEAASPDLAEAEALAHFTRMSDEVYPAFAAVLGGKKPTIKVRDMTSRWGVCVPAKRQITFALQLYNMPAAAQIYVVVHEYCHFLVPNHSMAFWAQVERILPDWKARRMLLK